MTSTRGFFKLFFVSMSEDMHTSNYLTNDTNGVLFDIK
jgi:hypothetical protein